MDPRDGAIRAMVSRPNFDLNFFSKDFKSEKDIGLIRIKLD